MSIISLANAAAARRTDTLGRVPSSYLEIAKASTESPRAVPRDAPTGPNDPQNRQKTSIEVALKVGARQGSCRVFHAASSGLSTAGELSATMASRSGLRVTGPSGDQSRVAPDQRAGLASRARMYIAWRAAKMA